MRACFIKTYARVGPDGSRMYPPQTKERVLARKQEGLEYGIELARMRAGGAVDLDDVLLWLSDVKLDDREPS